MPEFTSNHATQYKALSDDMRFYADQRYKILGAYLTASAFIAFVAKDQFNPLACLAGAALSLLCLAIDLRTARWWGTLLGQCQRLEDIAIADGQMIEGYKCYRKQQEAVGLQRIPHPKPSSAIATIYILGFTTWLAFSIFHLSRVLR